MLPAVFWLVSFAFWLSNVRLYNDHFGRISLAREIARYGALPFRDFFDPGFFMAEIASAGLQLTLGDNLLGEVLLNASFMASGVVLVLLLVRRVSGSNVVALAAALLTMASMPRAYDFDKVFLYPLGVVLCWRYIDRPNFASLFLLAAGITFAALFRYDTGVYIGCAAIAAVLVLQRTRWRTAMRHLAWLCVLTAVIASPFLVFVETHGGIGNAVDQIVTYGVRETEPGRVFVVDPPPPPHDTINVRWAPTVDDVMRSELSSRYSLHNEAPKGEPENRTWSYALGDESTDNIRSLVTDPQVEDTHLIDRERFTLMPEPFSTRLKRALPLLRARIRPGTYETNAAAFLYYLLWALPIAATVAWWFPRDGTATDSGEQARLLSLVVMCVMLDVFILRAPMEARVGGLLGPSAVLASWLASRVWRARAPSIGGWALPIGVSVLLAAAVWSLSVAADWRRSPPAMPGWLRVRSTLEVMSASPPMLSSLPDRRLAGLVSYVRECTRPEDRVYAAWFAPEVHFFAQRGVAGGMIATFSGHWSEQRFQRRIVNTLAVQPVPLIIFDVERSPDLSVQYPLVHDYLMTNYRAAGETDFGDPEGGRYVLLVQRSRRPTRNHGPSSMPCFA